MTLGKKDVSGPGLDEFDAPTEVAVAANGDFYVGDGHTGGGTAIGNARVMKFDRNGKFLKTWGSKGMGPGEFDVVHTIALDSRGRVSSAIARTTACRSSTRTERSSPNGSNSGGRAGCTSTRAPTRCTWPTPSRAMDARTRVCSSSRRRATASIPAFGAASASGARRDGSVQIVHSRSVPVSIPGRLVARRRSHRRLGWKRLRFGLPDEREKVRQKVRLAGGNGRRGGGPDCLPRILNINSDRGRRAHAQGLRELAVVACASFERVQPAGTSAIVNRPSRSVTAKYG